MSIDIERATKDIETLLIVSGYKKDKNLKCPILKILQMRYNLSKSEAIRIVKVILGEFYE